MKNFRNDIKINDLAQPFLEQIIEQMTKSPSGEQYADEAQKNLDLAKTFTILV